MTYKLDPTKVTFKDIIDASEQYNLPIRSTIHIPMGKVCVSANWYDYSRVRVQDRSSLFSECEKCLGNEHAEITVSRIWNIMADFVRENKVFRSPAYVFIANNVDNPDILNKGITPLFGVSMEVKSEDMISKAFLHIPHTKEAYSKSDIRIGVNYIFYFDEHSLTDFLKMKMVHKDIIHEFDIFIGGFDAVTGGCERKNIELFGKFFGRIYQQTL